MKSYPFYIIKKKIKWIIVPSPLKRDITHPCLWKILVAKIVAIEHNLKYYDIVELPYCQHRGRVVDKNIYIGDIPYDVSNLLTAKFAGFMIVYDEHENMTDDDVASFEYLRNKK